MIGNDIIDIAYTYKSTNWKRDGWLEKVCTPDEIELVYSSYDPFLTVWRMWTMKESAYKVSIKEGLSHSLNPASFETKFIDSFSGKVLYGSTSLQTLTNIIETAYISTVAARQINKIQYEVIDIGREPRKDVRKALITHISQTHSICENAISIFSHEKRIPTILVNNTTLDISISMSHHGQYGAFAIQKNEISSK